MSRIQITTSTLVWRSLLCTSSRVRFSHKRYQHHGHNHGGLPCHGHHPKLEAETNADTHVHPHSAELSQAEASESQKLQSEIEHIHKQMMKLYADGGYAEALKLAEKSTQLIKTLTGSTEHPAYASALNNEAVFCRAVGNVERAAVLYEQAIQSYERSVGLDHPSIAVTLQNLGIIQRTMKKYDDALRSFQRAYDIKIAGPQELIEEKIKRDPHVATILSNKASVLRDLGNFDEAIRIGREAVNILKRKYGEEHLQTASAMNTLALSYKAARQYDSARILYEGALRTRVGLLPAHHDDVIASLNNLAELYRALGDEKKALEIQEQIIAIVEERMNGARTQ